MKLSSHQLEAFLSVAKNKSFSIAAKDLNVTQSALSQRVLLLEEQLGVSVFVRLNQGLKLTEQGERLLRYAQTVKSLEEETLGEIHANDRSEFSGSLRIGVYSSVYRSAILPAVAEFLRNHPGIHCEFICAKMTELPGLLSSTEVDFIVMDYEWKKGDLQTHHLGNEKFVVISSKNHDSPTDVFLDNDKNDRATEMFFGSKKPKFKRGFFDDCYGIIDGVKEGLGLAVMSEHLVKIDKKLKILKKFNPVVVPVFLHYYSQPFYTKLQQALIRELIGQTRMWLDSREPGELVEVK